MNKTVIVFDLDDTLFKEIDFLKSAYRFIAVKLSDSTADAPLLYDSMLRSYFAHENVFEVLTNRFDAVDKKMLLDWYRYHIPDIRLSVKAQDLFRHLINNGIKPGIISDGRSITQWNKIHALGLDDFIDRTDIIISEDFGSEKPSPANYRYFMSRYPGSVFVYVGDNPRKDFVTPNTLGWLTIGLRDNGRNIHPQDADLPDGYQPQTWVDSLSEIKLLQLTK